MVKSIAHRAKNTEYYVLAEEDSNVNQFMLHAASPWKELSNNEKDTETVSRGEKGEAQY